jgi:hypothetical protein
VHAMKRLLVIAALLVGCSKPPPESDPAVVAAVTKTLSSRLAPVHDYRVAGVVENVTTKEKLAFTYAMKQPGFMKATVGESRAFIFDGKTLAVHDAPSKIAIMKDLGLLDESQQLMTLHDTFGDFVVEGWRPPLVKPKGMFAKAEGDRWIVTVPIEDAAISEQRIVLRAKDGAFVEKSILDKNGAPVSTTKVIEEITHDGLSFPKVWEREDQSGKYRVTLEKTEVNVGMTPEEFATRAPEGYTVQ